ncbi:radical SAM protein [Aquisphaera insulae]|uniref:radical SAM protein n=1 Tax=Aquisphaera insulae TaxID=2712864 RepID=UPI0013E9F557|nr:radical SAM protein [Aquisphaera insulae]
MNVSTLARLAFKHTYNHFAEEMYLHGGRDVTKPVTFYGLVNERCNVKCRYCEYWRMPKYKDEMSIEEWQKALLSIKEFVGTFSISFSGGEPFIKKGFLDLMQFCHDNGILAGVTTNGSALNEKNAEKLAKAHPWNLNVSVDAPTAEVHDYLRGYPGLFDKLSSGIKNAREAREKVGADFPIIIKTTVGKKNFRYLPEMVDWTKNIGATAMNFQPMDRWTPETYEELWVEEDELEDLQKVVDTMLDLKRKGEPIVNSDLVISLMVDHFREKSAPPEAMPCRVGMRDFFIRTNGDIEVCFFFPAIGNIKEASAREIWYSPKAREIRKQTVECDRLCLYTCLSQKTISDKVKMGMTLLTAQKKDKEAARLREKESALTVLQ